MLNNIISALTTMPVWEIIAVLFGIAYVILAARESLWGWFFGFFSTLIYTILFWQGALLSSALLNFYYMAMALYGFYLWRGDSIGSETLEITSLPPRKHLMIILAALFTVLVLGYLSSRYTDAKFTYLDSFVMLFSMIATWMLAKKILENWIYWVIIDAAAILLYWQSGYLITILLFALYILLAVYGYFSWRKRVAKDG